MSDPGHPFRAHHRPPRRAGLAAAVGGPDHIRCQHRDQPLHITGGCRGHELLGDLTGLRLVHRLEPLAPGVHVLARAVGDLADRRRGFADRRGDFVVVEAEHLAQHEHRALVGAQRLEHHQHRHRHRLGQHHVGRRVLLIEQQRLGQPRPDVFLATTGAGAQRVECLPGDQLREIRLRVADRRQVHLRPPQIAVLQHVVGFCCRAEDFVDDREQQRPQVGEPIGVLAAHPTRDPDSRGGVACRPAARSSSPACGPRAR